MKENVSVCMCVKAVCLVPIMITITLLRVMNVYNLNKTCYFRREVFQVCQFSVSDYF